MIGTSPNEEYEWNASCRVSRFSIASKVSSAGYAAQLPVNDLRKTTMYSYAEDEWKALPNLTVNMGARYSCYSVFNEVSGKAIPCDFATCGRRASAAREPVSAA